MVLKINYMHNRTKIVCTLGPATSSYEIILELAKMGMDVARLNFSHGTHADHLQRIRYVKRAREECKKPLAILADLRGPKIRVGKIIGDNLHLKPKQKLKIFKEGKGDASGISLTPIEVLDSVNVGMKMLFNDGYIIATVIDKQDKEVTIEIENEGILSTRKGVNLPNAPLYLPPLTPEDVEDLKFACKEGVDIIAASFIRSSEHILTVKDLISQEKKPHILVIAKIESHQGVENFESIVQVADGIMIARGDLGVELDLGEVPKLQKMMIRKCYDACKPSITATQMLESMIANPRPTRAEVSDVANAIYDGTSSVMLSAETATGKYPVETVAQMKKIIAIAEGDCDFKDFFYLHSKRDYPSIAASVAIAAVKTAYSSSAKAIFAYTATGHTARLVSRLRPQMPIIALTPEETNYHQLALNWGVIPFFQKGCQDTSQAFSCLSQFALKQGLIRFGDLVVVTAGANFGIKGSTNMMMVESIGNILVRGYKGYGKKVEGKVAICLSPVGKKLPAAGSILVIPRCDNSYLYLMKEALAVIVENHPQDMVSEKYAFLIARTFNISVVVRAEGARGVLQEGQVVTIDPLRGLIYHGSEEVE